MKNDGGDEMAKAIAKEVLIDALRDAKAAALTKIDTADGGTCNFDSAVFFPGRTTDKAIQDAAKTAGVDVGISRWDGARCVFVYVGSGQAARRTAMAEAAHKALRDKGLDAHMYYAMD